MKCFDVLGPTYRVILHEWMRKTCMKKLLTTHVTIYHQNIRALKMGILEEYINICKIIWKKGG